MALVSVIIGIYNPQDLNRVKKAVNSIINQTYSDLEVIICNDGSNENVSYFNDIKKMDSRILVISNEKNRGLAYSLNQCISVAKGDYIARMDDDDISDTNRIEEEVRFLELNKEYAFVGCNAHVIDNEDKVIGEKVMIETPKCKDFLFNSPFIHPSVIIRREALKCVGGYRVAKETRRAEDYDLWMRLYQKNMFGYNIQKKLFSYREDIQSIKKRKYKYRIDEAIVRFRGFKELNLYPLGLIYVIKPLIVGALPARVNQFIKGLVCNR